MTHRAVVLKVAQDTDATVVEALLYVQGTEYTVTASARRERVDAPNSELGEDLAIARALDKISAQLKRRARGLMNDSENTRITRERSKRYHETLARADEMFEHLDAGVKRERPMPRLEEPEEDWKDPLLLPSVARDTRGKFKRLYRTLGSNDDA